MACVNWKTFKQKCLCFRLIHYQWHHFVAGLSNDHKFLTPIATFWWLYSTQAPKKNIQTQRWDTKKSFQKINKSNLYCGLLICMLYVWKSKQIKTSSNNIIWMTMKMNAHFSSIFCCRCCRAVVIHCCDSGRENKNSMRLRTKEYIRNVYQNPFETRFVCASLFLFVCMHVECVTVWWTD